MARRCRAIFSVSVLSVSSVVNFSLFATPGMAQRRDEGARAFQKCISCHSVDPAEQNLPGPNLAGVVGRRAAALAGFDYSPAMKNAGAEGLVWSADALDHYLADPLEVLPGTTMSFPGHRAAAERRAVVVYLRRFP